MVILSCIRIKWKQLEFKPNPKLNQSVSHGNTEEIAWTIVSNGILDITKVDTIIHPVSK
jgi:hypothetical protein